MRARTLLIFGCVLLSNLVLGDTEILALSSGSFRLNASVEIVSFDGGGTFELLIDGKKGGAFGCSKATTTLKWPGLREKLTDYPIYNFSLSENLVQEVDALSQQDFYCDTFSGKGRAPIFHVLSNLRKNGGKKLELRVEGVLTAALLKDTKKRVETVTFTSVEFHEADRMVAKFRGDETEGDAKLSWMR